MPISFRTDSTCKHPHVTRLDSSETFFKKVNSLKKPAMCIKQIENLVTIYFYFRRLLQYKNTPFYAKKKKHKIKFITEIISFS